MAGYTVEQNNKSYRVILAGDLTASGIPELQTTLQGQVQQGAEEIIFDLAKTVMLDSSGIGLLIATNNSLARRGGRIRIVNTSADILQLLQSMRLATRLNVTGPKS
jgi:anti-anti-sigma factor